MSTSPRTKTSRKTPRRKVTAGDTAESSADVTLTSGEVCALAGIYQTLLDRWVTLGWITVEHVAEGRGQGHRRFTPLQALALVYGAAYRRAGASVAWTKLVVEWVQSQDLYDLQFEITDPNMVLVPLPESLGGPQIVVLPGAVPELSLWHTLTQVLEYLSQRTAS